MQMPQGLDTKHGGNGFPSTINRSRREFHELGAPSTLVLNQYCDDNVENGICEGSHRQRKPLVDRVIKMHELLGLKSKVFDDDMRGWSGW